MAKDTQNEARPKGGRPKLDPAKVRSHCVQLYLTQEEQRQLLQDFELSGQKSLSAYVAKKLFSQKQSTINPILLLAQIDGIGKDINRIGNNINQVARYANALTVQEKTDPAILTQFHQHMKAYHKLRQKLVTAYRAVIKNFN